MKSLILNGFEIKKPPKDLKLFSYPVIVNVPAGVTRTISTPEEFNGQAVSVQLVNQDGTNNGLARINGVTTEQFNIPPGGQIGFTDMWINQIQVVAGALASVIVFLQIVSQEDLE